ELFDRRLMRLLADRRQPVFGIGSGMQLLNVTMGGTLLLHIPEDRPTALPHHDPLDPAHRHTLEIAPNSLMERVYGDGELRVNSMHHMAIDDVAQNFEVTARCPDGIVEAIESRMSDWFAIGTQFHPESDTASALDLRLFEEFIEAVKESAASMRMGAKSPFAANTFRPRSSSGVIDRGLNHDSDQMRFGAARTVDARPLLFARPGSVILSAAKDLANWQARFLAALRMTSVAPNDRAFLRTHLPKL